MCGVIFTLLSQIGAEMTNGNFYQIIYAILHQFIEFSRLRAEAAVAAASTSSFHEIYLVWCPHNLSSLLSHYIQYGYLIPFSGLASISYKYMHQHSQRSPPPSKKKPRQPTGYITLKMTIKIQTFSFDMIENGVTIAASLGNLTH